MYPTQSPPVLRPHVAPPTVHDYQLFQFSTKFPFQTPVSGEEAIDASRPQFFREPVPCHDWCHLFGGFSFANCLRACG